MGDEHGSANTPDVPAVSRAPARALIAVLVGSAVIVAAQVAQRPVPAAAGITTDTPTSTPTDTATDTPSSTPTDTATNAPDTATSTPTDTATNTSVPATSTPTDTATNTSVPATSTPTDTATNSPIATATSTVTNTPSQTATVTGTPTRTPSKTEAGQCTDRIDNDNNGFTDCQDPACIGTAPCVAGAPALSPMFLVIGFASLTLIGLLRLRRRLE